MLMTDVIFLCVMLPLSLIFTIMTFVYKGIKWMSYIPAILWLIVGLFTITNTGVFAYQRYLSIIFFGLSFAMLFMPWAMKEGNIESPYEEDSTWWDEKDESYGGVPEDDLGFKKRLRYGYEGIEQTKDTRQRQPRKKSRNPSGLFD